MSKKILYKIIAFTLIIIMIDQGVGRFISHYAGMYKFDKRIGLLVDNKLDKEVIILGSSRALNGIDPQTIQKQTNLSCFNLAMSGSNVEFHETMLDLIISSKNHPKIIIYNIDDPATLDGLDHDVVYRKEELYPYVYNETVNEIVTNRLDKSVWATKISPTYHNNINFITAIKYLTRGAENPSYEINNINEFGANLMDGHQAGKENLIYQKALFKFDNESTIYTKSLLNIVEKCKKHNIKLIMVFPPTFYAPTPKFEDRILELTKNECLVINFSEEFKENKLFYNHGHLNRPGAIAFSKLISQQIIED